MIKKIIKKISLLILLLAAVLAGFLALLAALTNTERGLQIIVNIAQRYLPPEISFKKIEGRLFTTVTAHHVCYKLQTDNICIDKLSWHWDSKNIQASWRNSLPLQLILPEQSGTLKTQGSLSGPLYQPKIDATIDISTAEYELQLTTQLQLSWLRSNLHVVGEVIVNQAKITPHDSSQIIQLSDDIVIVSDEKQAPPADPDWSVSGEIILKLGNKIFIDYQGLSGQLQGELLIKEQSNKPTLANGQLKLLNGKYKGFGQQLDIETGELIFNDSRLDNPVLRARASRTLYHGDTKLTVGAVLSGELTNPTTTLFSRPDNLTQEDIISWLVLGRPAAKMTDNADAGLIIQALSSLHLQNQRGEPINNQLADAFGLASIDIVRRDVDGDKTEHALVLRKALLPNLLLTLTTGFKGNNNAVSVKYRLNDEWSIETQTNSQDKAIDLLYTIEQD